VVPWPIADPALNQIEGSPTHASGGNF